MGANFDTGSATCFLDVMRGARFLKWFLASTRSVTNTKLGLGQILQIVWMEAEMISEVINSKYQVVLVVITYLLLTVRKVKVNLCEFQSYFG